MAASATAIAKPPLSLTARNIRKSPMACGTRIPEAIVCAFSQRGACSSPASNAFTIGAQPAAAPGRIENRVRHLPAELFGKFEAHGLLAFDPVRLLESRCVEPTDLCL